MGWSKVGEWLKSNGGGLLQLAGSVATGNVPAGVSAVAGMISKATGETNPELALAKLQASPETLLALEKLAQENEIDLRRHESEMLRLELQDQQHEHHETQETIRTGDNAVDVEVRRTRPRIATESFRGTMAYCLGCWVYEAFTGSSIFNEYLCGFLASGYLTYMGVRTGDKIADAWKMRGHDGK